MVQVKLAEFLLARIDQDEAVALDNDEREWFMEKHDEADRLGTDMYFLCGRSARAERGWFKLATAFDPETGAHVARHDPARVLADCAAKRRIVEFCDSRAMVKVAMLGQLPEDYESILSGYGLILSWLTQPYADHPDYDEAWRV